MSGNNLYSFPQPLTQVFPPPIIASRAPLSTDYLYPLGQEWVDSVGENAYILLNVTANSATWGLMAGSSGPVDTLTGDSGGAILPALGTITLAGTANQITSVGSGHTITFSLIGPYTPATYTAHGVLIGEGTSSIVASAAGAAGTVLTGNGASSDPTFQVIPTLNIINNTTGTVASPTQIVVGSTYIANEASVTTGFLLPATAVQGQRFSIVGNGPGGWQIQQAAGQVMKVISVSTTVGTGGSLSSTNAFDCVSFLATVGGASTVWVAVDVTGTLTAV